MRRSKSDPAKYARNYRKISQRRMTQYDHIDEDKEIERLQKIIRDSESHVEAGGGSNRDETTALEKKSRRKRKEWDKNERSNDHVQDTSFLSEELLAGGEDLIILPNKKKQKKKQSKVQLTIEEIKEAKALQKKTAKKLQQLQTRAAQKKQRAQLYKKLEQHKISSTALDLMSRSGKISRKDVDTKKQTLQKLVKKERAGIELTNNEKDLLYPEIHVDETNIDTEVKKVKSHALTDKIGATKEDGKDDSPQNTNDRAPEGNSLNNSNDEREEDEASKSKSDLPTSKAQPAGFDFAAQMMASLTNLKKDTDKIAEEESRKGNANVEEELQIAPEKRYVPSHPAQLKTAAALGLKATSATSKRKVMEIKRPEAIEDARYNLPVSAMEFEIMDAIRNNDVTIVCGETGSGKSTQVPQYLYESGMCLNRNSSGSSYIVGITQPRRVAAVSTAKRVCYEMGCGDGQSIKGTKRNGNTVAYKTRYETAGCGDDTRVQFMTDGILLQEVQKDLLLRRYSVIVLDEAHERNLNTDVLIGLLSVALPLRKKAAQEDSSLVPLKLVLMSATLRVEDFTNNPKLFPMGHPAVVKVPGRTFPVTIHHSKVTELDKYESVAFNKICKIHRKLPQGGILVFLTGKGEIIRMVNKLRKGLNPREKKVKRFIDSNDISGENIIDSSGPREMDDEELDAEEIQDDFDDIDSDDDVALSASTADAAEDDNIPKKALVLPLYSLLSTQEQAKVFAAVPEDYRLIVVATNIAETSITIPGISYVVDTGRQKCRNYNSGTGVASYDVMWISKAAADQRAGRAGRTGPGHCYRLYSSSLYARHMDAFALPEVLTRPLEDIVLAMKALNISDVATFPFPTSPDRSQINAAVKLLSNIGCVDTSSVERDGGDGLATKLGKAVAKLPLGVRYAKILLVAAQAGILDYAIVVVSVLSEKSPFQNHIESSNDAGAGDGDESSNSDNESLDEIDKNKVKELELQQKKIKRKWHHRNGDILAAMLAVGAYTFAGQGAGGATEELALERFCQENGLNPVIMARIQKMRKHLASLAKNRLSTAEGIAAKTGGFSSKMPPPSALQERLLVQSIVSGLLDNIALLAPPGSLSGDHPFGLRSAYLPSSSLSKDPIYVDRNSTVFSRDFRRLPQWICYDTIIRKTTKDGKSVKVMKNITPVDPSWIGELAKGTSMIVLGGPLSSPPPSYNVENDAIMCPVSTKFGCSAWEIPPVKLVMYECLKSPEAKNNPTFLGDDSFRWFARLLLEGKVLPELRPLEKFLSDRPTSITRRVPSAKVSMLVTALSEAGVDSASALRKHWAENDDKFLLKNLTSWVKRESRDDAKKLWMKVVKQNIRLWKSEKDV